jgi:protein-tyrosine phosphatase
MSLMRRAYEAYAHDYAATYRTLFGLLLEDAAPLLFHCSAGKDRTGFGAALILSALGVHRDDVMQDYLATNRFWRGDSALARELPDAAAEILLRVHPELLDGAFAVIVREHGTLEGYFERALGISEARLAAWRGRMLG